MNVNFERVIHFVHFGALVKRESRIKGSLEAALP
jgi:hypothetical protein